MLPSLRQAFCEPFSKILCIIKSSTQSKTLFLTCLFSSKKVLKGSILLIWGILAHFWTKKMGCQEWAETKVNPYHYGHFLHNIPNFDKFFTTKKTSLNSLTSKKIPKMWYSFTRRPRRWFKVHKKP